MSQNSNENEHRKHVAIIMDGNGRWATARGLARLKGHAKGVDRVRQIVDAAPDLGVTHLTLFAFSTENWKRSETEVSGLMSLFRKYIRAEAARLASEGTRVRFIGERSKLDRRLRELMSSLEAQTVTNQRLQLTVAINYGGRDELSRAARRMAQAVRNGELDPEDICEDTISDFLDTAGLPDPDLVLRTSGEYRTSNFLTWQSVYAEYAFVETPWPDFTVHEFARVVSSLDHRERRFGAIVAQ